MSDDIWTIINESLLRTPQQTAWVRRGKGGTRELFSYGTVRDYALRLASALRSRGVGAGDIVGVVGPNGPEWGIAALAVWRLGAVVAPIHIGNSADDVAAQNRALNSRLVLTYSSPHEFPDAMPVALASLEEPPLTDDDPQRDTAAHREAARIYTSGSTGNPKMVRLSHRNISSNFRAASKLAHINADDRFLSLLPLSHAMEMTGGMLAPLSCGSSIILPRVLAAAEILEAIEQERISIVIGVPRLYRNIMRGLEKRFQQAGPLLNGYRRILVALPLPLRRLLNWPIRRRFGGRIKAWVSGGSRLDPEISEYFRQLGLSLRQGYGLTETSPLVSLQEDFDPVLDSVGKAVDGVDVKIHNPDPNGCGELWIRGANVMLGYVNEAQTREVMDGDWYKTGDIGRVDAVGNITLTGRSKRLIVTEAGKNVYPEELEVLLERFEIVKEAAVLERDARPVAIFALDGDDPEAVARDLIKRFNTKTSAHNQIARYAIVEELPRTPLGKVAISKLDEVFTEFEVNRS